MLVSILKDYRIFYSSSVYKELPVFPELKNKYKFQETSPIDPTFSYIFKPYFSNIQL
jgi:hypothetical protein